ncbi:hypothetical protein LJC56_10075 [Christensenellaceae bacterium OttesenSCG-928-K19]|nr:hypothetical protein [Christensenellaceae bacterium OttesenSCG-928-K19]
MGQTVIERIRKHRDFALKANKLFEIAEKQEKITLTYEETPESSGVCDLPVSNYQRNRCDHLEKWKDHLKLRQGSPCMYQAISQYFPSLHLIQPVLEGISGLINFGRKTDFVFLYPDLSRRENRES